MPAGQYETLTGRAYGELDPKDPHNAIITDIQLAPKNARGMVEYMATFQIVKPIDMSKASHLMWHDVPNRAGRLTIVRGGTQFRRCRRCPAAGRATIPARPRPRAEQ